MAVPKMDDFLFKFTIKKTAVWICLFAWHHFVLELCCHVYFNTSTRPSHTIDCDCLAEDNADKIFGASVATGVIKHVNQYRAILWKESRKTGQYDADFLSIASSGADARCLDASSHDAGSRQENAPSCSFSVVTWQDVVKRWREGKRRKH